MKRVRSVAPTRHLLALGGLALSATVGSLSAADHYYVNDHLATTTAVTDAAGEIAAIEADAFGTPVAGATQAARFTGKPYDDDIGAFVFPFRNYRSDEARWMSADPSGFPDGVNGTRYSPDPLSGFDPLGLATVKITFDNSQSLKTVFEQNNGAAAFYTQSVGSPYTWQSKPPTGSSTSGYSTSLSSGGSFSPTGHLVMPKLNSSYQGATVTNDVYGALGKHEAWHRDHFNAFATKVITVAETWILGYNSNLFNTATEASDALNNDINKAIGVVNSMFTDYMGYAKGNGHPETTFSNGKWDIPDPQTWGANVLGYVNGLNPTTKLIKTPGTFHRE